MLVTFVEAPDTATGSLFVTRGMRRLHDALELQCVMPVTDEQASQLVARTIEWLRRGNAFASGLRVRGLWHTTVELRIVEYRGEAMVRVVMPDPEFGFTGMRAPWKHQ